MFTPRQFEQIAKLPDDPVRQHGELMLSNGLQVLGGLALYSTLNVIDFLDGGGTRWFIDLSAVVAFSPRQHTPPPAPPP